MFTEALNYLLTMVTEEDNSSPHCVCSHRLPVGHGATIEEVTRLHTVSKLFYNTQVHPRLIWAQAAAIEAATRLLNVSKLFYDSEVLPRLSWVWSCTRTFTAFLWEECSTRFPVFLDQVKTVSIYLANEVYEKGSTSMRWLWTESSHFVYEQSMHYGPMLVRMSKDGASWAMDAMVNAFNTMKDLIVNR